VKISGLSKVDNVSVEDKLKLFKVIWDEMNFTAKQNPHALESSHFIVKTKLKYYLNPAFLQGIIMRTKSLINSGKVVEATHYLNNTFVDMVENHAWLKSLIGKVKLNYTTLIQSLQRLEEKNPRNYNHIINFLNLNDINKLRAAETIEKTRKIMIKIRKERKVLIKNHLLKS